jgi:hypothetical protein
MMGAEASMVWWESKERRKKRGEEGRLLKERLRENKIKQA